MRENTFRRRERQTGFQRPRNGRAVPQRFGDMRRLDSVFGVQVRNGPRDFYHPVITPRREKEGFRRGMQQMPRFARPVFVGIQHSAFRMRVAFAASVARVAPTLNGTRQLYPRSDLG